MELQPSASNPFSDDPSKFLARLFERLGDIPHVTWHQDLPCFHTSYDDWYVTGTLHLHELESADKSPRSSRPSSLTKSRRPSLPFSRSSESLSRRSQKEENDVRIVARVSSKLLRLQRQFNLGQSIYAETEKYGNHCLRLRSQHRLHPRNADESPLQVILVDHPGPNRLRHLLNLGPNWFSASEMGELHKKDPKTVSTGQERTGCVTLSEFLDFAIGACECVEMLHTVSHVVHGEIRGDSFHFNEETGAIKLVNYGSGTRAFEHGLTSAGWSSLSQEYGVEHKLQFIAPEQTGRLPAAPDSRTDIYSLGILFWNMLTGELPFHGSTALEVMQNVLSRRVPQLSSKRIDVPDALASVIHSMVQKNIEDRYHSATGLKYDLQQIQRLLSDGDGEALQKFTPRQQDVSCYFTLPNMQVGRDTEREKILAVIEGVKRHQQQKRPPLHRTLSPLGSNSSLSDAGSKDDGRSDDASINSRASSVQNGAVSTPYKTNDPLGRLPEDGDAGSVEGSTTAIEGVASRLSDEKRFSTDHTLSSSSTAGTATRTTSSYSLHEGQSSILRNNTKYVRKGNCEVITISGMAGLGKSTLVQSVQTTARANGGGYFASAKFDQARRTPFEPVVHVLSSLFRQIFSESNVNTDFHNNLRSFVRPVWPMLSRMLSLPDWVIETSTSSKSSDRGTPTPKQQISQAHSRRPSSPKRSKRCGSANNDAASFLKTGVSAKSSRFTAIFLDVLRFLSVHRLIILAFDDLQFADDESLELLQAVVVTKVSIAVIFTYRERDLLPQKIQKFLSTESTHITKVQLAPLTENDIATYTAATLHRSQEYIFPLVAVILEKSRGVPFFLREMLQTCYTKGCIWFSWQDSAWQFDLDKVFKEFESSSYGDSINSNDYVLTKFKELPVSSRNLVAWASLIGNTFSFNLVKKLMVGYHISSQKEEEPNHHKRADLVRQTSSDAVRGLQGAIAAYIIMPGEDDDQFRFVHDRYQTAARSLPESHNCKEMHFAIAQHMVKNFDSQTDKSNELYDLSAHVCYAASLVKQRVQDRAVYREVLFRAAERATESGARAPGLKYFAAAVSLLQENPWDESQPDVSYQETLTLYARAAECYWYLGHVETALGFLESTFREAKDAVDKAPAWILKSRIKTRQGDIVTGFKVLKLCLSELGFDLPPTSWEECDAKFFKIKDELGALDPNELLSRPLTTDRFLVTTGSVMCEIMAAAFWTDTLLFYQLALKDMWMHLHKGVLSQIGLAFVHFASISIGRHGLVEFGCEMGDLAQRFLELYDSDGYTIGRGWTLYALLIGHLRRPLHEALPQLEKAQLSSLHAGDRFAAMLNIGSVAAVRVWCSHNIADVEAYCSYAAEEIPDWEKDVRGGLMILAVRQFCRALQGKTYVNTPELILSDSSHNQVEVLQDMVNRSTSAFRSKCGYFCFCIPALFLYGHYDEAIRLGEEVACLPEKYWSHRILISIQFYISLSYLAVVRENPDKVDKGVAINFVRTCHERLIKWSKVNDVNLLVWTSILQAELYESEEKYGECLQMYEAASDHAEVHGMTFESALTSQLYAEWLIRRGANRPARNSLRDSIAAWKRLSAFGKAQQVAEKHEWLLRGTSSLSTVEAGCQTVESGDANLSVKAENNLITQDLNNQPAHSANGSIPGKAEEVLDMIDLKAILQSSETLSSTIDLDELLGKMTKIILDTTGSELSAIIIEDEDSGWCVAGISDSDGSDFPTGEALDDVEDVVGRQIILYCLRFKETVTIPNIFEDDHFSNVADSYRKRNPSGKAVIAIPILRGDNAVLGCVYVEGSPHSFTTRTKTVLQLLVNSIGISITNAKLFKRVEKVSASNAVMVESQKHALQQARNAEKKAKLAEAEANRNVRLKEEAARAKSMFLANVSHELRTPLNGVIGMSELLKSSTLSAEQESYAESIRVCADTLLTVINDLLDFSKLEAGKMQMFAVPLSLTETISEVVRALSFNNMGKSLQTLTDLDINENLLVIGDPVRLHQILMNLLSNAYKFTSQGSVTVKAVVEKETDDDITITCSVVDTGIGISDEVKQKLFLPFSQADNSTARSFGGTGLGLSICKAIIENVMRGKVWLESTLGQGTTVSFTLDFKKAPKDSVASAHSPRSHELDPMSVYTSNSGETPSKSLLQVKNLSSIPRDQIKVCIAEDNPINSKIAVSFVKKLGLNPEAFGDGQQAVDALGKASADSKPFHIVLMDVQMPVLDGYDATRAIRKHTDPAVREVLVIAMTASAIRGDREKCLDAGMNNYMAKPVRQQVLQEVLNHYLDGTLSDAANVKPRKGSAEKVDTNGEATKA